MKRLKKLLALLAVLVLLIGGYYAVSGMPKTQGVTETAGSFELTGMTEETLSGLAWANENGTFRFVLRDGAWVNDADEAFPVNQSALQNLAKRVTALTGTRRITDVTDPADYGLREPVFSVTLTDSEGVETVYAMGDATPFGDGYYLSVSGTDAIYTVETALDSLFDKTLTQLCQLEEIPSLNTVTRVWVSGAVDAAYNEATGLWTDSVTGEALDADRVNALADAAQDIEWSAVVMAAADEEKMRAFGLDDAQATVVRLEGGEDAPLELRIGRADEAGSRYACLSGSTMVYLIEDDQTEEILGAGMDTLWNRTPVALPYESLETAAFAWDGGSVTITPDTEGAENLWKLLTALRGTQRVAESAQGEALLSVSYTDTDGGTHSVAIYAYSVDSYLLPITDTHAMLVPADEVDTILRTLKNL